ncbi:MAG: conjugative transfer signal peptidase TraF [Proteobacteria bacterium]|nr:conjugative transfer signal peptidase TraF [Pseudomonadota bacterium]
MANNRNGSTSSINSYKARDKMEQIFSGIFLNKNPKAHLWARISKIIFIIALILLAAAYTLYFMGLRLNMSGSVPNTVYFLDASAAVKRGDYVKVCLNESTAQLAYQRGYVDKGTCPNGYEPLLKKVIGVPNDVASIYHNGMVVNDNFYPAPQSKTDTKGRMLTPQSMKDQKLTGYLLYGNGDYVHSWDSRYFGQVAKSDILGVAKPVTQK